MKKYLLLLLLYYLLIYYFLLFTSCNTRTPENYFDVAVLNCNMMHGFADDGMQRELESPTVKLVEGTKDQTAPMKRIEIVDAKIKFVETNLQKIKQLKPTDDTKDMLQASLALHAYVLPVYKTEYRQLAGLYDAGAPAGEIESLQQSIDEKYYPGFVELSDKLTAAAKPYAEKHHIQVNWDVHTSPQ